VNRVDGKQGGCRESNRRTLGEPAEKSKSQDRGRCREQNADRVKHNWIKTSD
jgi:hypothetical protein